MHKRITFIILVCLMITIIGCGKEDSVCSENIVHEMTLEILDPNSESCVENMIPIYYNNLDDRGKQRLAGLLKSSSVKSIVKKTEDTFDVVLIVPDVEKTIKGISKDEGFLVDKNTCELTNGDLEEVYSKYLNSYLEQNKCATKEETITLEVQTNDDGWVIKSDSPFISYFKYNTELELKSLLDDSDDEGDSSSVNTTEECTPNTLSSVSANGVFIISQDNHRYLIDNVSIKKGADGVNAIKQLSDLNKDYGCNEVFLYIEYTATNISSTEGKLNNGFVGVSKDGNLLQLDKSVGGLVTTEVIPSGDTKKLSTCVVLRNNDVLLWYDNYTGLLIKDY